ncbi:beta-1,6-N-acetylglucosaminyltransferase [Neisseria sp. Ec49-e6-T10]|uniref:beta-1,6-N-acetylglucosaminyltransferase n=1 Tax=Neisseria sp. Ec49-e6-T10 TaxID=3140744 RepID=UPI003EC14415
MIAYLILVHRLPNQFKTLFHAIYHPDNYYLIHIDKKSDPQLHIEIKTFLLAFSNASLLESKVTNWGGYSLVETELRAIHQLLDMHLKWQFFINLSGQDFPLKTQFYIHDYLNQHKNQDFIKVINQKDMRPETMNRIENYVFESDDEVILVGDTRKNHYMDNVTPYIGNQWMILSRKFCEFVTHNNEVERFKNFYKNTFIADEGFFQTVIMNTSYDNQNIINNDKREIDWVQLPNEIKLRPRNFIQADLSFLMHSDHLFARKFDESEDETILSSLETYLLEQKKNEFVPNITSAHVHDHI